MTKRIETTILERFNLEQDYYRHVIPECFNRESRMDDNIQNKFMSNSYYVYILAGKRNGTLYIGVTNDLQRRMYEHANGLVDGFTKKYTVHMLVYFEETNSIESAIEREKQLKKWNRKWKLELIEKNNPDWKDLAIDWIPARGRE